jgi:hypothetical protein
VGDDVMALIGEPLGRDQAQARAGAGDEDLRHEDSLTPLLVNILIRDP